MPELPEVQTVVDSLAPHLQGKIIRSVSLFRADILTPNPFPLARKLSSQVVHKIYRRGKRIIFRLLSGDCFVIHLGMSGRLSLHQPRDPRRPHTHLIVRFDQQEMRFVDPRRFGGIWWIVPTEDAEAGLGPEPLSIRPKEMFKRLSKTRRPIKTALLDQALIAGLGNIYVDESLHRSNIHPTRAADELTPAEVQKLTSSIKSVLRRAIKHKGSTLRDHHDAAGKPGKFQKLHRVYHQTGKACQTCGNPIAKIIVGGRSTHFCAQCQLSAPASAEPSSG